MIIKSSMPVDQEKGTTDLAAAVEYTAFGATIDVRDIQRMLVWHTPDHRSYLSVCAVLLPLCEALRVRGVRVVGITPNVFALGLYPAGQSGRDNPAGIVLLEVDTVGHVHGAEEFVSGSGRLSLIFDAHKNDAQPEGWLASISAGWKRTTMLELLQAGQLVFSKPSKPAKAAKLSPQQPNAQRQTPQIRSPKPKVKLAGAPAPQGRGPRRERQRLEQQLKASMP